MKQNRIAVLAVTIVVIILSSSAIVCTYNAENDKPAEFIGTVIGLSSYNQPKLDLESKDVFDAGLNLGSTFTIITDDHTYHHAILLKDYLGMFMFDVFVNVEKDGKISIGIFGELIFAENGSTVKLVHEGTSDRYSKTPKYNSGLSNDRSDYPSDEMFTNFYEITGGSIADDRFYRSFSPLTETRDGEGNPVYTRAYYVNELAYTYGIEFDIALSFTDAAVQSAVSNTKIAGHVVDVCGSGDYVAPDMKFLYFQQPEKTKTVLDAIIDNGEIKYLIHCNQGRDRTAFVALIIQSLAGATSDEMRDDEAKAFANLYNIDPSSEEFRVIAKLTYDRNMYLIANPDKITEIAFIDWDNIDVSSVNTKQATISYCIGHLGMTAERVNSLIDIITADPSP